MPTLHSWTLTCPDCDAISPIVKLLFSAEGDVRIVAVCPDCEHTLNVTHSIVEIMEICRQSDTKKGAENEVRVS